jgi:hypothetical protein
MAKQVYTIWTDNQGGFTLIQGLSPLSFANGSIDPECKRVIYTLSAGSMSEAQKVFKTLKVQPLFYTRGFPIL